MYVTVGGSYMYMFAFDCSTNTFTMGIRVGRRVTVVDNVTTSVGNVLLLPKLFCR